MKTTPNTEPVIRISGASSLRTGQGAVSTTNPSPRGVVNIGPDTLTQKPGPNIENVQLRDIAIQGAGVSWSWVHPSTSKPELNHSIGLCMDSSEPGGGGGVNYQNTVSGVSVEDVDIGVYLGEDVNANSITDVMMQSIGEFAYLLTLRATENTIKGGFVGGGGGKVRPLPFFTISIRRWTNLMTLPCRHLVSRFAGDDHQVYRRCSELVHRHSRRTWRRQHVL